MTWDETDPKEIANHYEKVDTVKHSDFRVNHYCTCRFTKEDVQSMDILLHLHLRMPSRQSQATANKDDRIQKCKVADTIYAWNFVSSAIDT